MIARIIKFDKCRNAKFKQEPVFKKFEKKELSWNGHVRRLNQGRMLKKISEARLARNRRRGRPRNTKMEQICWI